MRLAVALLAVVSTACVRSDGRNSDCRWPGAAGGSSLRADAELAEDLAIRYADTHHGQRTPGWVSGEVYVRERDRCMGALFQEVAKAHGVSPGDAAASLRHRGWLDVGLNLPLVLLYLLGAAAGAGRILLRYPPAEGWTAPLVMLAACSLLFAIGGMMAGEQWSWAVEGIRMGNGHMSYRGRRLPWARYRGELFLGMLALF